MFCALLLSSAGHACRVLEGNAVIGGCHRVDRVDGVFSEHGPRVYGSNFLRYKRLLRFLGLRFEDHYVPYRYSFPVGLAGAVSLMSAAEVAGLAASYARFMVQPRRYDKMSVAALLEGFSDEARAYFDKICKLTDGAGVGRYTAGELFRLVDQGLFYRFYEPRAPTDEFLWAACAARLAATGRVRSGPAPGCGPCGRGRARDAGHGAALAGGATVPVPGRWSGRAARGGAAPAGGAGHRAAPPRRAHAVGRVRAVLGRDGLQRVPAVHAAVAAARHRPAALGQRVRRLGRDMGRHVRLLRGRPHAAELLRGRARRPVAGHRQDRQPDPRPGRDGARGRAPGAPGAVGRPVRRRAGRSPTPWC